MLGLFAINGKCRAWDCKQVLAPFDLSGRTAIVTGGSRGIGKAITLALAVAGADVAITARTRGELDATAQEVRALGRRALAEPSDVTKPTEVDRFFRHAIGEFGKIDILVNNAGPYEAKPFLLLSDEEWDETVRAVLHSQRYCLRAIGQHMIDNAYGKIINISSILGIIGVSSNVAYGTSKAAVIHLTKALAVEWGKHGVRVNAICPGHVRTPATEKELDDPRIAKLVERIVPLKYVSNPEDIAPAAVYMASSASDYMNGHVLVLDGALSIS